MTEIDVLIEINSKLDLIISAIEKVQDYIANYQFVGQWVLLFIGSWLFLQVLKFLYFIFGKVFLGRL